MLRRAPGGRSSGILSRLLAVPVLLLAVVGVRASAIQGAGGSTRISTPGETGAWTTMADESDVLPVNAVLLPTEQVLILAGSGNQADYGRGVNQARLWDPATGQVLGAPDGFTGASIPAGTPPTWHDNDTFCSGHVLLPNGNVFIAGGNLEFPTRSNDVPHEPHVHALPYDNPEIARPACHDFLGSRSSWIFHPNSSAWTRGPKMASGRWYPTALSLGDGRVLMLSGLNDVGMGGIIASDPVCRYPVLNPKIEVYSSRKRQWGSPRIPNPANGEIDANNLGLYPYVHLLPTGNVFLAGPSAATEMFDPDTLIRQGSQIFSQRGGRDYGFSTLLALRPEENYHARVLNVGGGNGSGITNQAEVIDLSVTDPQWSVVAPMVHARAQGASVLLPDGKVLVIGGTFGPDNPDYAVLEAEIYDPVANTWSSAGTAAVKRLYHSVAIVLPDGRVFVGGSNPHHAMQPGEPFVETRIEVYSPPYLFQGARPTISSLPDVVKYGKRFDVRLASAGQVNEASQVVLLRPGSTTHTRNFDQRLVGLTFKRNASSPRRLRITAPPDGNIAPPGYYMLFVLDGSGVPSEGRFIRLEE
jgi:hypothetical protein